MPRFYFHLQSGPLLEPDPEGLELPDEDAACREAKQAAREMITDAVLFGGTALGNAFVIAADDGHEVAVVAFRDVIEE
jgi:hypothetical protein